MGDFLSNLSQQASNLVNQGIQSAESYAAGYAASAVSSAAQAVAEPLVKVADQAPTGNLTAAQVAAGKTGSTPPIVAKAVAAVSSPAGMSTGVILALVVAGYFFLEN